jgi:hypothetical protein
MLSLLDFMGEFQVVMGGWGESRQILNWSNGCLSGSLSGIFLTHS